MKRTKERLEQLIAFYSKEPKQTTINEYIADDLDEVLDELKREEPSVPIDENFESMMISALRYALGRKSYIVSMTLDYLTLLLPSLSTKILAVMERDIEEQRGYEIRIALARSHANAFPPGEESPTKEYDLILSTLKKELERRKKEVENG